MIITSCPSCHVEFNFSAEHSGKVISCPKCECLVCLPTEATNWHGRSIEQSDALAGRGRLQWLRNVYHYIKLLVCRAERVKR